MRRVKINDLVSLTSHHTNAAIDCFDKVENLARIIILVPSEHYTYPCHFNKPVAPGNFCGYDWAFHECFEIVYLRLKLYSRLPRQTNITKIYTADNFQRLLPPVALCDVGNINVRILFRFRQAELILSLSMTPLRLEKVMLSPALCLQNYSVREDKTAHRL